jgi:hypothetical protein
MSNILTQQEHKINERNYIYMAAIANKAKIPPSPRETPVGVEIPAAVFP